MHTYGNIQVTKTNSEHRLQCASSVLLVMFASLILVVFCLFLPCWCHTNVDVMQYLVCLCVVWENVLPSFLFPYA